MSRQGRWASLRAIHARYRRASRAAKPRIPLRSDGWDGTVPGFPGIDRVAHSGESSAGEFLHSLDLTDVPTTWVETRAGPGFARSDSQEALARLNELDRTALRRFPTPVLPAVQLVRTVRVGSRVRRVSDRPPPPLDRVRACPQADPVTGAPLPALRAPLDPFARAQAIDEKRGGLYPLARHRAAPPAAKERRGTHPGGAASHPEPLPALGAPDRRRVSHSQPPGERTISHGATITPTGTALRWRDRPASGLPPGRYVGTVTKDGLRLEGPTDGFKNYFMPRRV